MEHIALTKEIQSLQTPEEEELQKKSSELKFLEETLLEKELELATLAADLQAIESRYMQIVGARFAKLDDINKQIAAKLAHQYPRDQKTQQSFSEARKKARDSARTWQQYKDSSRKDSFIPTKELKELYRSIAKKIHPDLAEDEEERIKRSCVMAEVNKAYKEGDIGKLREILYNWETSPDVIVGNDIGSKLVRTIRMIVQVKRRLAEIEKEIISLKESDIYLLKVKIDMAKSEGRDLIDELSREVDMQIADAMKKLDSFRTKRAY